ncbi:MAG: GNAT family N-acetyltransferase [Alphaproteobacteria bacterium]
MIKIVHETDTDPQAQSALLDEAFGPDRKKKTAYRLRDGVAEISDLSFAAYDDETLIGTIRFWPAQVRAPAGAKSTPILILGPLAVAADYTGQGVGLELINRGLERAGQLGHRLVILVGDLPYYARAGFQREGAERLSLPGPVDPARLLICELAEGAAAGLEGRVEKADGRGKAGVEDAVRKKKVIR